MRFEKAKFSKKREKLEKANITATFSLFSGAETLTARTPTVRCRLSPLLHHRPLSYSLPLFDPLSAILCRLSVAPIIISQSGGIHFQFGRRPPSPVLIPSHTSLHGCPPEGSCAATPIYVCRTHAILSLFPPLRPRGHPSAARSSAGRSVSLSPPRTPLSPPPPPLLLPSLPTDPPRQGHPFTSVPPPQSWPSKVQRYNCPLSPLRPSHQVNFSFTGAISTRIQTRRCRRRRYLSHPPPPLIVPLTFISLFSFPLMPELTLTFLCQVWGNLP